jgi:class 3 adenylate cyclase
MNEKRIQQTNSHKSELLARDIYWQNEINRRQEVWEIERESREKTISEEHIVEVRKLQRMKEQGNLKNKEQRLKVLCFIDVVDCGTGEEGEGTRSADN